MSPIPASPKKLPIDLERIDTRKGIWLVAVETVAKTESGDHLLLRIILEQRVDDEHFRTRELAMQVRVQEACQPDCLPSMISRIREWIESTEGDGFVDTANPSV